MAGSLGSDTTRWYVLNKRMDYFHENGRYPTKEEFINYMDSKVGTSTMSANAAKVMAMPTQDEDILFPDRVKEQKQNHFNKEYKIW